MVRMTNLREIKYINELFSWNQLVNKIYKRKIYLKMRKHGGEHSHVQTDRLLIILMK